MTACSVIVFLATQASGAAGTAAGPLDLNPSQARESAATPRAAPEKCPGVKRALRFYVRRYNGYRAKMGAGARAHRSEVAACPRYLLGVWVRKAHAARIEYLKWHRRYVALYEKWRCIHEHEGAWNAHNPPYHGGLQFDDTFQTQYGPEFLQRWGGAENWPVWAQLEAAERAYHGFHGWAARGFGPWPNTRRMCGV